MTTIIIEERKTLFSLSVSTGNRFVIAVSYASDDQGRRHNLKSGGGAKIEKNSSLHVTFSTKTMA